MSPQTKDSKPLPFWQWQGFLNRYLPTGNSPKDGSEASQPDEPVSLLVRMELPKINVKKRSDAQFTQDYNNFVGDRHATAPELPGTPKARLDALTGSQLREIILAACLEDRELSHRMPGWVKEKNKSNKVTNTYDQLGLSLQNFTHWTLVELVLLILERDKTPKTHTLIRSMACRFESANAIAKGVS